ncbi:F-box protein [Thalictrum thalictroides]|uniref:F-box protein n=1 Tax=Thalictrum thalictroides TaxID=46969 RepID=A0A7J6VS23_THATH|nr:F-box protein [Thalictrum thalictroides]
MSNPILQTCDDATPMKSMRPNHSMWVDRWMTTSCNSTSQVHTQFSMHDEGNAKGHDLEQGTRDIQIAELSKENRIDINAVSCETSQYMNSWGCQRKDMVVASNIPQSAHAVEAVTEAKRVEITYDSVTTNSSNLINSGLELNPVSMFDFGERPGCDLAHKHLAVSIQSDNITKHVITTAPSNTPFLCRSDPTEVAFHTNDYLSHPEGRFQSQMQSVDKKSVPTLRLFQDKLTGSNFNSVPHGLQPRELQSSICRKEEGKRSSSQVASKEQFANSTQVEYSPNYDRYSSFMVRDKQMENDHAGSRDSGRSHSGKTNGAMQLTDPSLRNIGFPMSYREPSVKRHKDIFNGLRPSHSCPGQVRLEELNNNCHVPSGVPQPVHRNGKLRLFGSVNSDEGVSRAPKFSQTINQLSITELSKGNTMFKGSTIPSNLRGSAPPRLFTVLPNFDSNDERSEKQKLRPLGSPRRSEEKKHVGNESTGLLAKNESSAETDTMDINACQTWNSLPSITSSRSNKDTIVGQNKAISHSTVLRGNVGSRKRKIELPDVNREPLSHFVAEKALSNTDMSLSRTESLDLEHLHVDQTGNSNSSSQQCPTSSMDPSCRWIKRLRLSSSEYNAHGTKNVKLGDFLSTAEVKRSYNKNTEYKCSTLRPTLSRLSGERVGPMELDKTSLSLRSKEHTSINSMKEYGDINLSHPWIQRWCHNQVQTSKMKSVSPGSCELDSSKMALDEYQTKHFPSIAAMALMGKTMNGLQACKFQNKGSFVVWNTEKF